MRLWIPEKPSVAVDIVKAIGGTFERHESYFESETDIVAFCVGHVMEMIPPEIVNPAYATWSLDTLPLKLYPARLQPKKEMKKLVEMLVWLIKQPKVKTIIHCGDPDDEGQLLVDEVLEYAGNTKPVKRALINDATQASVKKAISSLRDNNEKQFRGMYLKALARSVGDAIYGYSMSRAYSIIGREKGYTGLLSVGRVQTPVLGLIVRRWRDFTTHKSSFYYTLAGNFINGSDAFCTKWTVPENAPVDEESRLNNKQWASDLAKSLAGKSAVVRSASVAEKETAAPLPFNLARLYQYMTKNHKLTSQQTLDITQKLKDGKAITYNRSDCSYLSEEQYKKAPVLIDALKQLSEFNTLDTDSSRKSKAFNTDKLSAHTAIIPTDQVPDLSALTTNEKLVYLAIAKLYLAQFLAKKTYLEATAEIECSGQLFTISARKTTNTGFTALLDDADGNETDDHAAFERVSHLCTGNALTCCDVDVSEKKTKPAPLFTEDTLMNAMVRVADFVSNPRIKQILKDKDKGKNGEFGGIGTSATRAGIIETLKERNYVTVEKGKFIPTAAGIALIDALPEIATQPDLTAIWAEKQDAIEQGKMSVEQFINGLYVEITHLVKSADINISAMENAPSKTQLPRLNVACPSCGSEIILGEKACNCTGCSFRIWRTIADKKLTQKQIETLISKGKSGELKGFKSANKPDETFSAFVVLEDKTTGATGFEFPPRKTAKTKEER
ncbi:type IA DNA topoisomerase [Scandinavium goeteborgense]|uniref:DNA topoisomerase n=1 Tax=Scandinavium goeteborgense TaxID=1851514 RepID=A0A4R6DSG6_SCAGO|nr:type IA DNA topoisomerase [Scandinavium goeteborgense]TDN48061.1 DNA topoisomerase-3 [Scandinavium goeteborgense]